MPSYIVLTLQTTRNRPFEWGRFYYKALLSAAGAWKQVSSLLYSLWAALNTLPTLYPNILVMHFIAHKRATTFALTVTTVSLFISHQGS
jgi:hypothetical protein